MEDEFFLKKMKGVKAFKKDEKFIKFEKNKTKIEIKVEKNSATAKRVTDTIKNKTDFKLTFGEINKELKRGKVKIDIRNFKSAIKDLDTAIKINSELVWAYYDRGYVKILVAKNSRSIESKIKYCKSKRVLII